MIYKCYYVLVFHNYIINIKLLLLDQQFEILSHL